MGRPACAAHRDPRSIPARPHSRHLVEGSRPEAQWGPSGDSTSRRSSRLLERRTARAVLETLTVEGRATTTLSPPSRRCRGTPAPSRPGALRPDTLRGQFVSDGRPHRGACRGFGGLCHQERALVRPFAAVPKALSTRLRRMGVPPTDNVHATDTLPDELWLGLPLSTRGPPRDLGQKASNGGVEGPILRGRRCRECLSRFKNFWVAGPLAVGSWSYRLRHTLRRIAIRRKIALQEISNPADSQTPKSNIFSRRPEQGGSGYQSSGSSWSSAATTARSSLSRS
jgi:hypothetical protein